MARKAMVPSKNSRQIVRPHVFNLGKTEATSIGKFGTHIPLVQKFPEFGAIFPQSTPSEGPTCRVRLWEGRTCRVRLLEGPACRVRGATLDYPSCFVGHDKHAPPTLGGTCSDPRRDLLDRSAFWRDLLVGSAAQAWTIHPDSTGTTSVPLPQAPLHCARHVTYANLQDGQIWPLLMSFPAPKRFVKI